jgi:hypothetical protein
MAMDLEEQQVRIVQMEADILQKRQAYKYFTIQLFVNATIAVAALMTAVFAGGKILFGH